MKAVPFAAFGYVIFMCDAEVGDVTTLPTDENGKYSLGFYFFTAGLGKVRLAETNETLPDRVAGWLSREQTSGFASTQGTLECTFKEPSRWVCMPFDKSSKGYTDITSTFIPQGETIPVKNGSNIFLAEGSVSVNEKVFKAPAQIRIRSGDTVIKSIDSTVYLLNF